MRAIKTSASCDIAAKKAGTLTKVGLRTFVDPRREGGRINAETRRDLVRLIEIDGRRMQSVPGGTHWGGGMSISAHDQARADHAVATDELLSRRDADEARAMLDKLFNPPAKGKRR